MSQSFSLAIHGGAGTILRVAMTPEKDTAYRSGLADALEAGRAVLSAGGAALDAVQAAVVVMENNPLFNAGTGAVFTNDGKNEQDACLMDGATLRAGAVARVTKIRNPILAARLVLDRSDHLLFAGDGAEQFVESHGMALEPDPTYFFSQERWDQLEKARQREARDNKANSQLDHSDQRDRVGTVGAVACDSRGNLAAATSTGGMTNKRFGRVGDSPIIGAGTYAHNDTCAVSTTGVGEYFMRLVTAYDLAALMAYRNMSLVEAADVVIHDKLTTLGGSGGLIAVDAKGQIAMPFNSDGMYRGWIDNQGRIHTRIFADEA